MSNIDVNSFIDYLGYVTDWFNVLLPRMRRYLYVNNGPIISVQVRFNPSL